MQVKDKCMDEVDFESKYVALPCYLSAAQSFAAQEPNYSRSETHHKVSVVFLLKCCILLGESHLNIEV